MKRIVYFDDQKVWKKNIKQKTKKILRVEN